MRPWGLAPLRGLGVTTRHPTWIGGARTPVPLKGGLAILALIALVTVTLAVPPKKHRTHKNPTALRQDLRRLHQRKQELQNQLHTTKVQTHAVLEDIEEVDNRLNKLEAQLDDTNDRLDSSRDEQKQLAQDLVQATADLDATREKVRKRLRQLYMQGEGTAVSILIGSSSAGDLASREYMVRRIADGDRRLFEQYRRLRAETESRKRKQDEVVHRINGLLRNQESQQADLKDTRQEKDEKLQGLRQKQDQLKRMIAQFDQDERDIASEIAAFSRRTNGGKTLNLGKFSGHFSKPVSNHMTSSFGMRFHPILHKVRMHTGIDFGCPVGTAIHAAGDGVVILTQRKGGYGNTIVIEHGGGMQTLYGHCSSIGVSPGQRIKRGQVIGRTGNSGLSTGPHLHFEVRVNGHPVNPVRYL